MIVKKVTIFGFLWIVSLIIKFPSVPLILTHIQFLILFMKAGKQTLEAADSFHQFQQDGIKQA